MAEAPIAKPAAIAIPSDRSWWDPRLILSAVQVVPWTVPCLANEPTQIVGNDPRRLALVVFAVNPAPVQTSVIIDPDPTKGFVGSVGDLLRFTLFDWPGIVQGTFYVYGGTNFSISGVCVVRP